MPRSRYQIADSQQFQSVLTSNADVAATPPDPRTREWDLLSYRAPPSRDERDDPCDRFPWILVSVHAEEVLRANLVPTNTPPLDAQTIRNSGQRVSLLGARLVLSDDTQASRIVDVDLAGGFAFTWAGSGVAVKVLTQENGGPSRTIPPVGLSGTMVVDTIVGASATEAGVGIATGAGGGGSLSPTCLRLTQTKFVAPGGAGVIFQVPAGACRVSLYQSGLVSATAVWLSYYQGPELAPVVSTGIAGFIQRIASIGRQHMEVPGTSRALAIINPDVTAQKVTAIWEIEL